MKNVLVTGGAGFIGSHLCEALVAQGYAVRVLDNLAYGRREWVPPSCEFILGDITDAQACHAAAAGMDGIFHLAAMSRSGPSQEHVDLCTRSNVVGTQNMLLAARDAGVKRFIYSGSATAYGNLPPPHREDGPLEFLNIYALTKRAGEQYSLLFDAQYDVPALVLRYFSAYGPRQPQTGAYALVLGIFLRRWREGLPLEIHGDGHQRRDFIHVRDIVAANIAAYESGLRGEILNIGSGSNISVRELAGMISSHQTFTPARKDDSLATLADISRAQDRLGWQPRIAFADGLEELKALIAAGKE
ncbi:MAG TPA: NAD-dependent epimerase/dehydratase family protein [Rhizomicrobium sp.]|nr:NAD-dependent epimerase/dehydratase family protein [Rhizomicrobium sp.]